MTEETLKIAETPKEIESSDSSAISANSPNENSSVSPQEKKRSLGDLYDRIKNQRSFKFMPEEMLRVLLQVDKMEKFKEGEEILKEGEPNDSVYIILLGTVGVSTKGKHLYSLRRTGDVFGELSFIRKENCSAAIKAESHLIVAKISFSFLKELGEARIYKWLCLILSNKLDLSSGVQTGDNKK